MFQNTHKVFFFENGLYHIPERKYHSREKLENVLNSKETRKEIMLLFTLCKLKLVVCSGISYYFQILKISENSSSAIENSSSGVYYYFRY